MASGGKNCKIGTDFSRCYMSIMKALGYQSRCGMKLFSDSFFEEVSISVVICVATAHAAGNQQKNN